ncbi:hypothetical protein [Halococcus saccharolyticus]|uniref:Uncharacterized protein n=1 Tax=Halococcus saccharolyticus DSM 5350 TaxID=1227455 RepID=M0MEW7_9EURY|nr:hypothetical protein [Halococcus saccharolyticus]EMA43883.1 hypothetical protein C449_12625 [Halococcus saccharolyticus DSM 5350]
MTESDDSGNRIDRRGLLRRIGALGVTGVVGVGGFQFFATEPVFALEKETFTAADVSIDSADGTIDDIWFQPELTYSWGDLDSSPHTLKFTLSTEGPDGGYFEKVGSESKYNEALEDGKSASGSYDFQNELSLIENTSWYKSAFSADGDGESKVVDLTVQVKAELATNDGTTHTDTKEAPFSINVTNRQVKFGNQGGSGSGSGGVGGIAGTGGN